MQKPYVFWRKTALTAEKKDKEGRYFRDLGRESNPRPSGGRESAKKMKIKLVLFDLCISIAAPITPDRSLAPNVYKYPNISKLLRG